MIARELRVLLALALVALLSACGGDGGSAVDGADVSGDATMGSDAAGGDAGADIGSDAAEDADAGEEDVDVSSLPIVEVSEPTDATPAAWMIAELTSGDSVIDRVRAGTLDYPAPGTDEQGVTWTSFRSRESATLPTGDGALVWAVARVDRDDPGGIIVRNDGIVDAWSGGYRQPGDVYRSNRHRVPLFGNAGGNVVAVRIFRPRREPIVQLWTTPDEVYFNTRDITWPHLVVGRADAVPVGIATLNLTDDALRDVTARVVESEHFEETTLSYPGVGRATTQIGFLLQPKQAWTEPELEIPVTLQLESPSLSARYRVEITLNTIDATQPYRRTFVSPVDDSVQYYGVREPTELDAESDYALVLTLHGAGVEAIGQARAYSSRPWNYIIAPTNRRPFGFDWEAWGRHNAIASLDHAMESFSIDPTRVYLTGHSMGGHGTWHNGVHFPGRFAVVGPSAGWASFYSYGGSERPGGPFARSQAASDTRAYLDNLADRGIYIIHGSADDNVPVREGRTMFEAAQEVTDDVVYHEEEGAGHWWNGDRAPGADCVDWPPLFEFMRERTLDPNELEFTFRSPGPWVNPNHSYVTIQSAQSATSDVMITSAFDGERVALTTDNVRSMTLDGEALLAKDVASLTVDGDDVDLVEGPIEIGPEGGKRAAQYGPLNQVFERPFCLIYESNREVYAQYAAWLLSNWNIIGNGHGCALPTARADEARTAGYNLVWLGVPQNALPEAAIEGVRWDARTLGVGSATSPDAALAYVYPDGDRLGAVFYATVGAEELLFRLQPFTSRLVVPDYIVWTDEGAIAAGFFTPEWTLAP